jgi:hypothetical protein
MSHGASVLPSRIQPPQYIAEPDDGVGGLVVGVGGVVVGGVVVGVVVGGVVVGGVQFGDRGERAEAVNAHAERHSTAATNAANTARTRADNEAFIRDMKAPGEAREGG